MVMMIVQNIASCKWLEPYQWHDATEYIMEFNYKFIQVIVSYLKVVNIINTALPLNLQSIIINLTKQFIGYIYGLHL